jgi:hypothetical protein
MHTIKRLHAIHLLAAILLLVFSLIRDTSALAFATSGTTQEHATRPVFNTAATVGEPSDPLFADEWALAHIGAGCAWQHTTGSADVTVAVVDSGVDMEHPDLAGRLRSDGYDFVDDDSDPSDANGHGTNVTGIVAATLDNAEGGAGLAPGVLILPVRVMNAKGFGSDSAIARGVRYAADKGVQVINLSLGATLTIGADTQSELVSSAIRYAQEQGALVVVAAGNDFVPLPNAIVGDNPNALIVAATDEFDVKADFSNSGSWIGVAAPGVHILSTMPTYDVYLTSDAVPPDERFQRNYDYMSGTSQATPLVSALAALLFSLHPDWTAAEVSQTIKDHTADISQQNRRLAAKGFLGSGRIDACAALDVETAALPAVEATPLPPAAPTAQRQQRDIQPEAPAPTTAPISAPEAPPAEEPLTAFVRLLLVAGAAGALLLAGVLAVLLRVIRRRRPPAPSSAPLRTPAMAAPQPQSAAPQQPGAWGALSVVGGPASPLSYPLAGAELLIGREDGCPIQLVGDATVSRRHALVRNDGRQIILIDAGSSHGTYINGYRIAGPVAVRRGMLLQVGQTLLRFD